jgi:hypothetical protein
MQTQIGEAAGKVWSALEANGSMATSSLKKKAELDNETMNLALGWLAREGKVSLEKVGKKKIQVSLK